VTHRPLSALAVAIVFVACGGGDGTRAKSSDAVVEIEAPKDEPAAAKDDDVPVPPARRTEPPVASAEPPVEAAPAEESPWALWGSGGGGPDCDRAADCCLKFAIRTGPNPSMRSTCDSFRQAPSTLCAQLLSTFRSAAPQAGIQCN
jgi:hypothetical protein